MTISHEGRVTTLWKLKFQNNRVSCVVYRGPNGMEMRLEAPAGTILTMPFEMQPRSLARTKALRESLKKRGWLEER